MMLFLGLSHSGEVLTNALSKSSSLHLRYIYTQYVDNVSFFCINLYAAMLEHELCVLQHLVSQKTTSTRRVSNDRVYELAWVYMHA